MEVKINREIRDYTESMFFGLSLRQFIFALCACLMAVILWAIIKSELLIPKKLLFQNTNIYYELFRSLFLDTKKGAKKQ